MRKCTATGYHRNRYGKLTMREVPTAYVPPSQTLQPTLEALQPALDAVVHTAATLPKRRVVKQAPGAMVGGMVRQPRKGARGIAGARYDLLTNKVTLRALCMMSDGQLAQRYQVSRQVASRMKVRLSQYGVDGVNRTVAGVPKAELQP